MARPLCLFTGQWADLPLETLAEKAQSFGYEGLELACWGDHFDVQRALKEDSYCQEHWELLQSKGILSYATSTHLVGQAVCDLIDDRHKAILPDYVWGDGDPEGVRQRAAEEVKDTARATRKFFDCAPEPVKSYIERRGYCVVNGFTGSSIWHALYGFPPFTEGQIDAGFEDFAARWGPIFDVYEEEGCKFALEVHPTEIAFDTASSRRSLEAVDNHPAYGFNFDPSHFGYQHADYLGFIQEFADKIYNVHVKDVWWSDKPADAGVFGGHAAFGTNGRYWEFASPGRGKIDFEGIIRQLNHCNYDGPLTVEWEDCGMDREHGATEAAELVKRLDFKPFMGAFDAAFSEE